ncbi:MAG: response regulator [Lentisphaerae bacterium]|nr:response regulator [Lentisphaerota bacterium]
MWEAELSATDAGFREAGAGAGGPAPALAPCRRRRVLLVDDERMLLDVFRVIILSEIPDVTIDTATDGAEAVRAFSSFHHALLLMDLRMPVMDGRQAFVAIENLCRERNWEMPAVVFCSGYAPPEAIRRVVAQSRRHHLLPKPVGNDELVEAVRSRLEE